MAPLVVFRTGGTAMLGPVIKKCFGDKCYAAAIVEILKQCG